MKRMKKYLSLLVIIAICLGLCACGEDNGSSADKSENTADTAAEDAKEDAEPLEVIRMTCEELSQFIESNLSIFSSPVAIKSSMISTLSSALRASTCISKVLEPYSRV